ncbi:MAG: homoserine dehydrogenase [Bacillota bacterium]|nr:homoserine dehydrogenase [Bacillota bacterium]
MMNIAILGCGTIGAGVAHLLLDHGELIADRLGTSPVLRHIVDIAELGDPRLEALRSSGIETVLEDPTIDLVVETIGGTRVAYDYTRRCLLAGRHVVTSNKDLVAAHGVELLELANSMKVRYLFEAAVGGGIPVIATLAEDLAANRILSIHGIVNGTTNYILDRMETDSQNFAESLAEAQRLGYAERNPASDIDGLDSGRKLAILAALASGRLVDWEQIPITGIREIEPDDLELARRLGCYLRLIAGMVATEDGNMLLRVAPTLVPRRHPLAVARGVYNAILIHGSEVGDSLLYGQGAGAAPTASAVLADITACMRTPWSPAVALSWQAAEASGLVEEAFSGVLRPRDSETYERIAELVETDGLDLEPLADGAGRTVAWRRLATARDGIADLAGWFATRGAIEISWLHDLADGRGD